MVRPDFVADAAAALGGYGDVVKSAWAQRPPLPESTHRPGLFQAGAWLLLGVASTMLSSPDVRVGHLYAQVAVSLLSLLFGTWVFWCHGGGRITAAGVISLAFAAFVGYAGLWWAQNLRVELSDGIYQATVISYLSHVLMWGLFWRSRDVAAVRPSTGVGSAWALVVGFLGSVGAAAIALVRTPGALVVAVAFSSAMLVSAAVATRPTRSGHARLAHWIVLGVLVLAYTAAMFNGYGRLTVVALAFGPAIALSSRGRTRLVKGALILCAPLATLILNSLRSQAVHARYGTTLSADEPDSFVTPLQTFGRLIDSAPTYNHAHGATLFADLTIFIPHNIWPSKPDGFGQVLTAMFEPGLLRFGQSMAALAGGEWFYDFGFAGVVGLVLVVGFGVRKTDDLLSWALSRGGESSRTVWWLAVALVLTAGLPDLAWNGLSTYLARTMLRLAVLIPLLALAPRSQRASLRPGDSSPDDERTPQAATSSTGPASTPPSGVGLSSRSPMSREGEREQDRQH